MGKTQTTWLTQAKLIPPRLREDIDARKRLLATLEDKVLSYPLTPIARPQDTAIPRCSFHCAPLPGLPMAWLALDDEDTNLARFLSAFVAALLTLHPDCGTAMLALLSANSGDSFEPRNECQPI